MFNFKNGAFLLGLIAGVVLTALIGIFVLMLIQVTRAAPSPEPIAIITVEPTAAPVEAPTAVPAPVSTAAPLAEPNVTPAEAPTKAPAEGPTPAQAQEPAVQFVGVPKTGQTGCWDANGALIDCAGTGQDGEYQLGTDPAVAPAFGPTNTHNTPAGTGVRFVDNGDGTVTDNVTGLIWLKNANCFERNTWAVALNNANMLASPACGLSDGSVAGDWRLPNANELYSLIDPTQSSPPLPTGHPFANVQIEYYWTSTTIADAVTNAWLVGMQNNGFMTDSGVKAIDAWNKYVWPVRGGQ